MEEKGPVKIIAVEVLNQNFLY